MRLSLPIPALTALFSSSSLLRLRDTVREFFAYHGVWALGVRLLRRMTIRDKILIVLALVALPMVPMGLYLVASERAAYEQAELRNAGVKLSLAVHAVTDALHARERSLDLGRVPDERSIEPALEQLALARAQAEAQGLAMPAAWEAVDPVLARARQSRSLSVAGQVEALAQARQALSRLHVASIEAGGLLLTQDRKELLQAVIAHVHVPGTLDEMWSLMRAVRAHLAVQDRIASEGVRVAPTMFYVAGRIEALEQQLARLRARLQSPEMGEVAAPGVLELKTARLMATRARAALSDDGYFGPEELIALRAAEDAGSRELGELRRQKLEQLLATGERAREAARLRQLWVVGGSLVSVALALYLFYAFYLVMRGGLSTVNEQMLRMSRGDLSRRVRPLGGDEVAETLRAVSLSVERLGDLLASVRHGSSSVSHAAQQIAVGNSDLRSRNHRTSESLQKVVDGVARYSAQLEACAAQVEKVVGTVQALRLQSTRSRRQMERLRETLHTVRAQGQQVQEAVSLIDNVAFRTNILALNASVEASKAGESGRGFAVVAQEVRSLALRSAEAARRIGSIVGASADQVEQSTRLAEDAGAAIADSDGHIDLIHGAMSDVSNLTREGQQESAAILEQVRALRETTEKNLGLVEQLANASHSLRSHGERLTHRLTHFKLG